MRNLFFIMSMLFSLTFLAGCRNPFFPDSGVPVDEPVTTRDPLSVLKELQRSYEERNLSLFKKLIYDEDTFRYYIEAPQTKFNSAAFNHYETDSLKLIEGSTHNYITLRYADELQFHSNLFRLADEIYFMSPLLETSVDYFVDTLIHTETNVKRLDTTFAVVHASETTMKISSLSKFQTKDSQEYPISGQVFCMKKDRVKKGDSTVVNWKIWKWFEVN